MRPWSDCFRQADLDPRLAEGLVRRALGRVKRLADRGILPSDSPYAQIAQVRDTADERMELAQMIGQALAAGDQGRARRLIGIGGTMFGHAPMVAAVEARAREAQLATLKAEQDRWSEDPVAEQYPTLEMEHDPDRQRRTNSRTSVSSSAPGGPATCRGITAPGARTLRSRCLISDDMSPGAWS